MKSQAPTGNSVPILIDENARTFQGGFGPWTSRPRGKGTLILTAETLTLDLGPRVPPLEIPIDKVDGLAVAQRSPSTVPPLLRVTYRKNLVLGVTVAHPERWVNAIQTLTRQAGRTVPLDREEPSVNETRPFRVVVLSFLVLILLLSVALPLLFSWMHGRAIPDFAPGDPSTVSGVGP